MDPDISRWVVEFILREQLEDNLVKRLLTALPSISLTDSRLNKTLLLWILQSEISNDVVSEKLLDHLEMVQEFDRAEGVATASQSMKDAYCAMAVECTVQILQGDAKNRGFKYLDAVVRIWRERIGDMVKSLGEKGLVSEQLRKCKDEVEASLWDPNACQDILKRDTRNDALRLVRDYVSEEWEKMGPSFLLLAAAYELKKNENVSESAQVDIAVARDEDAVDDLGDANDVQANEADAGNVSVEAAQAQANVDNPGTAQGCGHQKDLHKPSLMERNSTACTFEFDDSIDDFPERVPTSRTRRAHIRSPRRRKTKRWSLGEEDALRTAVRKYGHGNWKVILNACRDVFEERTEVDLKDKWRNMTRH